MSETMTRQHLLEHARVSGFEAPILAIFKKIDEAMKNAKNKAERDIIALQGLQEIDVYFGASSSNLNDMNIQGTTEEAIKKVIGKEIK